MRYIDADKIMEEIERIGGHNLCEWETIGVKALVDRQPAADVVPKSEVNALEKEIERLKDILNHYALQYGTVVSQQKVIDKAKSEVASGIMREVRQALLNMVLANSMGETYDIEKRFAEIEKKYTEEKE